MNNTMIVSEALAHLPTIDYRELKELQGNLKDLTEDNYLRLKTNLLGADGIPSNGFFIPFYVWFEPKTKTPYIVDGHQRQRVLTAENVTPYQLPYIEIKAKNKKQAKEKLLLISSQYGKTTREGFEEFAHDLDVDFIKGITTFGGFTLPPMEGFNYNNDIPASGDNALYGGGEKLQSDSGEAVEKLDRIAKYGDLYKSDDLDIPEDGIETDIVIGDYFEIGEHRLVCGDSTNKTHFDALMRGEKADLYATDPPYGVSYADKNKYLNTIAFGNRIQTEIIGDHLSLSQTSDLWDKTFELADANMSEKSSYYIFSAQGGDLLMMMMMIDKHFQLKHCLIWIKNNHVLGRCDYSYKHEPILYGWRKKHTHEFYGGFKTSTFHYNKPLKNDLHPTMKPVELIAELIENSTIEGGIVLDTFLGSGTAMIASHGLKRRCFGLELSPKYCQVIIDRMLRLSPSIVIKKNGMPYQKNNA